MVAAFTMCSKLNPKLSPADQFDVIKVSTDCVFPLPLGNISPNLKKKEMGIVSCVSFMSCAPAVYK